MRYTLLLGAYKLTNSILDYKSDEIFLLQVVVTAYNRHILILILNHNNLGH